MGENFEEPFELVDAHNAFAVARQSLAELLDTLGIAQCAPALEAEDIDLESVMLLSDADMRELGLKMGPRRKLTAYITGVKADMHAAAAQAAVLVDDSAPLSPPLHMYPTTSESDSVGF